jgi:hypothetical protein
VLDISVSRLSRIKNNILEIGDQKELGDKYALYNLCQEIAQLIELIEEQIP